MILQLTSLGKLDVAVDALRITELVKPDPLRNFVIDKNFQVKSCDQIEDSGIWPSSKSDHHESKQHWYRWLFSPELEKEDIYCKLLLLDCFCQQHNIRLCVYQGYSIEWSKQQYINLKSIIKNINSDFYGEYQESMHYQNHNHEQTVPCMSYQIELAQTISQELPTSMQHRLEKIIAGLQTPKKLL